MTTTIEIPVPDGTAEAYVAGPDDRSAPGVLFFMDAFGLRPQIGNMLERIAGWGYTVAGARTSSIATAPSPTSSTTASTRWTGSGP